MSFRTFRRKTAERLTLLLIAHRHTIASAARAVTITARKDKELASFLFHFFGTKSAPFRSVLKKIVESKTDPVPCPSVAEQPASVVACHGPPKSRWDFSDCDIWQEPLDTDGALSEIAS
jgi:hypothetical protein